jgi:transcriptional regulator GlxA family with amidase domain
LILLAACSSEGAPVARDKPDRTGDLLDIAASRRLQAGFLIVDGVYNTELTAPYDVLEHTVHHLPNGLGIDVFTVSPTGEAVTTAEGLRILPDHGFDATPPIDILVVPSAQGSRDSDLDNQAMIEWVRRHGDQAQVVMSLCWGAFVLAQADLLDGRACTTFPSDYGTFARRFPEVNLLVNVSFVDDGRVITSQGGARSFDPAMYLVEMLYGQETARMIGAGLLIPWPPKPESGTTYYVAHDSDLSGAD